MAQQRVVYPRRLDEARGFRIGLAVFGVLCCVIVTLTMEEKSLGTIFGLAFSLAWWSEIAKRLPIIVGVIGAIVFLAAAAYRVGWESVIFLLLFLAVWRLASGEWLHHA